MQTFFVLYNHWVGLLWRGRSNLVSCNFDAFYYFVNIRRFYFDTTSLHTEYTRWVASHRVWDDNVRWSVRRGKDHRRIVFNLNVFVDTFIKGALATGGFAGWLCSRKESGWLKEVTDYWVFGAEFRFLAVNSMVGDIFWPYTASQHQR